MRSDDGRDGPAQPAAVFETDALADSVRDAERIRRRLAEDEEAAELARELYAPGDDDGLPDLEPDAQLAPLLMAGERLHAKRRDAVVEVLGRPASELPQPPSGGTLYLTSKRLLHLSAARVVSVCLEQIEAVDVVLERLLSFRLAEGVRMAIEASQPRLLRVQLAAAMTDLQTESR